MSKKTDRSSCPDSWQTWWWRCSTLLRKSWNCWCGGHRGILRHVGGGGCRQDVFEKMEIITKICSADCLVIYLLTLFAQADLSVSKGRGRGYIFWVGFGWGFQSFFGNDLSGSYSSYSKDSWSLDDKNPPKKWLTFLIFHWSDRRPTQFVRVPPDEILVFLMNFIFFGKTR